MSKKERVKWGRYPRRLAGVRLTAETDDAIRADPLAKEIGRNALVRQVLEAHFGGGAKTGAHLDAQEA